MSKANPASEEIKKHGDELDKTIQEAGQHNTGHASPIPAPDNGSHPRSAAAHLNEPSHLHGNTLQGGHQHQAFGQVNALREPPQEVSRTGKQHRGQ